MTFITGLGADRTADSSPLSLPAGLYFLLSSSSLMLKIVVAY